MITYNGKQQPVEPMVMKLLNLLYSQRGKVLNKEQLKKALWPDTMVTEDSLTKVVSKLRKVLDQDLKQSAITTINRSGYLLRKPDLIQFLQLNKVLLLLSSAVVFLLYFIFASGLVHWAINLPNG